MFITKTSAGFRHAARSGRRLMICAALGAATASLFAADAYADADHPLQKVVRYGDLDLSKRQDAGILYTRLERAARAICRPFDERELSRRSMKRECEQTALSAAVEKIDSDYVTELHEADARVRVAQQRATATPRT